MKKTTIYTGATIGILAVVGTGIFVSNNKSPLVHIANATSTITYKHYNAIEATENGHGCVEFWVNCSDFSYLLSAPSEGNIIEGGNITDNPSFDWDNMDPLDQRFVPSINQQKSWGMVPVVDLGNNRITYGLYPQTVVDDSDLLAILEDLPSSSISELTGFYYYNGNFYQNCIGARRDGDSHFSNGQTVINGTKYWFYCEPISWVIMSNSNSTYQLYTETSIYAGLTWGYSDSDTYETSQVREWLNGTGTYEGSGFFQTALFNSNEYIQKTTISLDDGSSTLTDDVRLLTKGEAEDSTYFADDKSRIIVPNDWSAAHKACFNNGSTFVSRWWLCEANTQDTTCAYGVGLNGRVGNGGKKTSGDSYDRCIRPTILITCS